MAGDGFNLLDAFVQIDVQGVEEADQQIENFLNAINTDLQFDVADGIFTQAEVDQIIDTLRESLNQGLEEANTERFSLNLRDDLQQVFRSSNPIIDDGPIRDAFQRGTITLRDDLDEIFAETQELIIDDGPIREALSPIIDLGRLGFAGGLLTAGQQFADIANSIGDALTQFGPQLEGAFTQASRLEGIVNDLRTNRIENLIGNLADFGNFDDQQRILEQQLSDVQNTAMQAAQEIQNIDFGETRTVGGFDFAFDILNNIQAVRQNLTLQGQENIRQQEIAQGRLNSASESAIPLEQALIELQERRQQAFQDQLAILEDERLALEGNTEAVLRNQLARQNFSEDEIDQFVDRSQENDAIREQQRRATAEFERARDEGDAIGRANEQAEQASDNLARQAEARIESLLAQQAALNGQTLEYEIQNVLNSNLSDSDMQRTIELLRQNDAIRERQEIERSIDRLTSARDTAQERADRDRERAEERVLDSVQNIARIQQDAARQATSAASTASSFDLGTIGSEIDFNIEGIVEEERQQTEALERQTESIAALAAANEALAVEQRNLIRSIAPFIIR